MTGPKTGGRSLRKKKRADSVILNLRNDSAGTRRRSGLLMGLESDGVRALVAGTKQDESEAVRRQFPLPVLDQQL